MKPLIRVRSRYCTDCSICSIATVTGINYEAVLRTLLPNKKKHADYGASLFRVIICLRRLGFKAKKINNPIIRNLKSHSLLVVKVPYSGKACGWDYHAVIWDAKKKVIIDGNYRDRGARRYQKAVIECYEIKPV